MKKINKVSTAILSIALILGLAGLVTTFAATDPGLGAAATFSIIAQTAITGTGTISGDVGMNSTGAGITGLTDAMVGGTIYSTDGVAPGLAILAPAVQANLSTANDDITAQASTDSIGPALDGLTLTTGVYDIGAGRLNGGVLTLDGPGIYIFRASSDFVSSGSINLTNGARACDVYWQVNTLATINGSSFVGTIIAGTGVHFGADVVLDGQALALGGDVTLLNNTISGPTCAAPAPALATLHVVKTVINDNGGTAVASDFTIDVTGTNVSPSSFAGSAAGVDVTLDAGSYEVTETSLPGYLQSGSGDCSGTIAVGETKTCTITNNDIAPDSATLHVVKTVINDNGGTAVASDFNLHVKLSGSDVAGSPVVGTVAPGTSYSLSASTYVISEDANASYTQSFSGDCDASGNIILSSGDDKICTITNNDIAPDSATLRVIKTVINNSGGTAVASDFTLNVTGTNVSNPSFAGSTSGVYITLDAGSYAVTEPVVPSGYLQSGSGDCSGTIAAGETKICTITNDDIATAVVNDAIPKPPNTGIGPDEKSIPWNVIVPAGIFSALILFYFTRRKQTA